MQIQQEENTRFFIFSQILTEYVTIETEGVCMYVRACVRLCHRYSPNGSADFNEILHTLSLV